MRWSLLWVLLATLPLLFWRWLKHRGGVGRWSLAAGVLVACVPAEPRYAVLVSW